jgi:hypothetical protein
VKNPMVTMSEMRVEVKWCLEEGLLKASQLGFSDELFMSQVADHKNLNFVGRFKQYFHLVSKSPATHCFPSSHLFFPFSLFS